LQRVGYRAPDDMPLPQHGRFDAATEHAVRQFQRDQGLPDSGRVDPDTLQALSVAQHVRIELTKAAEQDAPAAQSRRASLLPPTPTADSIEDAIKRLDTYPLPDIAPTQPLATQAPAAPAALQPIADQVPKTSLADANIAARVDPHVLLPREPHSIADEPKVATDVQVAPAKATPSSAREQPATDVSRLSPEDQAMFAKIRGQAPDNVPDATVAHAMLEAKRNGIPDAERVGQVGVVGGTLWVGSVTPGFMAGVSATAPAPPMQDTVREAQAFNQQRDQQLAQEAMQRSQDDPSQGPKR
ncbi:peptidoglycan-binding domain-containing protein, partial [Lysobacter sp. 2RAB21]